MTAGAAHIAGLILASSTLWAVAASAQTCDESEAALSQMFDRVNAQNGRFTGSGFLALSDGEKWHWTASLLDAQIIRLDAMLRDIGEVPPEQLRREARAFAELDDAEACYRPADVSSAAVRFAPDKTDRSRLRAEIEVIR